MSKGSIFSALGFSEMHSGSIGMTQPSPSFIQSYSYACAHTHTCKDALHAHMGFAYLTHLLQRDLVHT